jgi:hypothetical protein
VAVHASSAKPEATKLFECVAGPVGVTPPPSIQSARQNERRAPAALLAPVCPEGQVPQPIAIQETMGEAHEARFAPSALASSTSPIPLGNTHVSAGGWTSVAGAGALLEQYRPYLSTNDDLSLAQMALHDGSAGHRIEFGWAVSPLVGAHDYEPHVFTFIAVGGVAKCWNGCGWQQISATHFPGMNTPTNGSADDYAVVHWQGNWWLSYQGVWMGFFPDSVWGGGFTQIGLAQWFGEVATFNTPPCSAMGNGRQGATDSAAAQFQEAYTFDANLNLSIWPSIAASLVAEDPTRYTGGSTSYTAAFRYGGGFDPCANRPCGSYAVDACGIGVGCGCPSGLSCVWGQCL